MTKIDNCIRKPKSTYTVKCYYKQCGEKVEIGNHAIKLKTEIDLKNGGVFISWLEPEN